MQANPDEWAQFVSDVVADRLELTVSADRTICLWRVRCGYILLDRIEGRAQAGVFFEDGRQALADLLSWAEPHLPAA